MQDRSNLLLFLQDRANFVAVLQLYLPAKFFVNRYVRYKYACPHCQGSVSQGPLPPRPIDKGIPGPGVLADLIASKFAEHLPLYRIQERYRRAGIDFSLSTFCDWVAHVAEMTSPIVEVLRKMGLNASAP